MTLRKHQLLAAAALAAILAAVPMAAQAQTTEIQYTGNGSATSYAIPFPYIQPGDIAVTVNGVTSTGWAISSPGVITFTVAPAAGQVIDLKRITNVAQPSATFQGGALSSTDLNANQTQDVFSLQELRAGLSHTIMGTLADVNNLVLPSASSRAGKYLGFDGSGNLILSTAAQISGGGSGGGGPSNNVQITGGSIDGTPIGGSTPAAGTFTRVTATAGPVTFAPGYGAIGLFTNPNVKNDTSLMTAFYYTIQTDGTLNNPNFSDNLLAYTSYLNWNGDDTLNTGVGTVAKTTTGEIHYFNNIGSGQALGISCIQVSSGFSDASCFNADVTYGGGTSPGDEDKGITPQMHLHQPNFVLGSVATGQPAIISTITTDACNFVLTQAVVPSQYAQTVTGTGSCSGPWATADFAPGAPTNNEGAVQVTATNISGGIGTVTGIFRVGLPLTTFTGAQSGKTLTITSPSQAGMLTGEVITGSGVPAGETILSGLWLVQSVAIDTAGTGCVSPPTVSFTGGHSTAATATATLSGDGVASVAVSYGGGYYYGTPTVTISGGSCSGVTAHAVVTPPTAGFGAGAYYVSASATISSEPMGAAGLLSNAYDMYIPAMADNGYTGQYRDWIDITAPTYATGTVSTVNAPGSGYYTGSGTTWSATMLSGAESRRPGCIRLAADDYVNASKFTGTSVEYYEIGLIPNTTNLQIYRTDVAGSSGYNGLGPGGGTYSISPCGRAMRVGTDLVPGSPLGPGHIILDSAAGFAPGDNVIQPNSPFPDSTAFHINVSPWTAGGTFRSVFDTSTYGRVPYQVGFQTDGSAFDNTGGYPYGYLIGFNVIGAQSGFNQQSGRTALQSQFLTPQAGDYAVYVSASTVTGHAGQFFGFNDGITIHNGNAATGADITMSDVPSAGCLKTDVNGAIGSCVYVRQQGVLWANINAADGSPQVGDHITITDASACTVGTAVSAGAGTTHSCPTVWNGANWMPEVTH